MTGKHRLVINNRAGRRRRHNRTTQCAVSVGVSLVALGALAAAGASIPTAPFPHFIEPVQAIPDISTPKLGEIPTPTEAPSPDAGRSRAVTPVALLHASNSNEHEQLEREGVQTPASTAASKTEHKPKGKSSTKTSHKATTKPKANKPDTDEEKERKEKAKQVAKKIVKHLKEQHKKKHGKKDKNEAGNSGGESSSSSGGSDNDSSGGES